MKEERNRPTISRTYDIVTEESAAEGDCSEHGFCTPGGWKHPLEDPVIERDTRENPGSYWVAWSLGDIGDAIRWAREHGCTENHGNGSFCSADAVIEDYSTDEQVSYAIHFNGFTDSTLARIGRALKG